MGSNDTLDRLLAWAVRRRTRIGRYNPWEVVVRLWREVVDDRLFGLAAEMAFFALLSLAPLVLAFGAALGYLERVVGSDAIQQAEQTLIDAFGLVFATEALSAFMRGLLDQERGSIAIGGLVATLWLASRVFTATIRALDLAYGVEERRNLVVQRIAAVAFALASVIAVSLLVAIMVVGPLLGGGRAIADRLGLGDAYALAWTFGRWPVLALALIGFLVLVYRFAPATETRWRDCLPGAVLGVGLWLLLSAGLRVYLTTTGGGAPAETEAVRVVGQALSAVVAGILWVYLSSIALLLGGALNAELGKLRQRSDP